MKITEDLFKNLGVEVDIITPENFLKIKETLTRIGIPKVSEKKLYQSCHILHKRDSVGTSRYVIIMFKEMFELDGKDAIYSEDDIPRRNAIVKLLVEWGLLKVLNEESIANCAPAKTIKVISFKEKSDWELCSKYTIGKK